MAGLRPDFRSGPAAAFRRSLRIPVLPGSAAYLNCRRARICQELPGSAPVALEEARYGIARCLRGGQPGPRLGLGRPSFDGTDEPPAGARSR